MTHVELGRAIEALYGKISERLTPESFTPEETELLDQTLDGLEAGTWRVAERDAKGTWQVNEWLKKAILLEFRRQPLRAMNAGDLSFFDKISLQSWSAQKGVRAVPSALARRGAHIAKGCVLMPSYVNIGAFVDAGSMVDTWATVGSCAQVGKSVHISGGVGLGGVLEPVQSSPVIIEDHVFLGSRAIVVEGVIVEEGAVIGAGVVLTASTKIIDVRSQEPIIHRGRVPARSVVIPGTQNKKFPAGEFGVPCALIIGERSAATDHKTTLNQVLRDFEIPV